MPYFRTEDGCRLYYEAFGMDAQNPVIVFLNGTLQTTVHWTSQVRHFQESYRILLYDGRAQGRSDLGKKPLGIEVHAADLYALMQYLNVTKANLVGLSHGAGVALAVAEQCPETVERLALCSIADVPSARAMITLKSWRKILIAGGLEAAAWAVLPAVFGEVYLANSRKIHSKIVKAMVLRNRPDSLLAHLEAMSTYPSPARLVDVNRRPTLVISGPQDPLVSMEGAKRLADQCQGTHHLIPGVGHTVPLESPDHFNRLLEAFLSANGS